MKTLSKKQAILITLTLALGLGLAGCGKGPGANTNQNANANQNGDSNVNQNTNIDPEYGITTYIENNSFTSNTTNSELISFENEYQYKNNDYSFKITYPKEWKLKEEKLDGELFVAIVIDSNNYIVTYPVGGSGKGLELKEFTEKTILISNQNCTVKYFDNFTLYTFPSEEPFRMEVTFTNEQNKELLERVAESILFF